MALTGANYVFVTIKVGGSQPSKLDKEITARYGIDEAVGDTTGPGGIFYLSVIFLPSWISAGIWKNSALTPGS